MLEKVVSFKVDLKMGDKLQNKANELGVDVSHLLREMINKIDESEDDIKNNIEYHKYQIRVLTEKLNKICKEREDNKSKIGEKRKIEEKIEGKKKHNKKIANDIIKKVLTKHQSILELGGEEEMKKTREIVIEELKEELKGIEGNKEDVGKIIIHSMNKILFKLGLGEIL